MAGFMFVERVNGEETGRIRIIHSSDQGGAAYVLREALYGEGFDYPTVNTDNRADRYYVLCRNEETEWRPVATKKIRCEGSNVRRAWTTPMAGMPWMRKCPYCNRFLDENGGNTLPVHFTVTRVADPTPEPTPEPAIEIEETVETVRTCRYCENEIGADMGRYAESCRSCCTHTGETVRMEDGWLYCPDCKRDIDYDPQPDAHAFHTSTCPGPTCRVAEHQTGVLAWTHNGKRHFSRLEPDYSTRTPKVKSLCGKSIKAVCAERGNYTSTCWECEAVVFQTAGNVEGN
jgi:hypothetical protein